MVSDLIIITHDCIYVYVFVRRQQVTGASNAHNDVYPSYLMFVYGEIFM